MSKTKEQILDELPIEVQGDYFREAVLRSMDQFAKSQSIAFNEFVTEARNEEGEVYINKNPYGIKPGYYTSESLYRLFIKHQQSQKINCSICSRIIEEEAHYCEISDCPHKSIQHQSQQP